LPKAAVLPIIIHFTTNVEMPIIYLKRRERQNSPNEAFARRFK